jgi:hypothetical protein
MYSGLTDSGLAFSVKQTDLWNFGLLRVVYSSLRFLQALLSAYW